MKQLPVPSLEQTMAGFCEAVEPLVAPEVLEASRRAAQAFADGDGPAAQEALRRFADAEHGEGRSWLSTAWFDGYFGVRTPLPLTSNTYFELAWEQTRSGVDLAADVVAGFAAVHLAHLRGEFEIPTSARGEQVDPGQFGFLSGGIRIPRERLDVSEPGDAGAGGREVVVLHRGHAAALTVSDADGHPLPASAIGAALAEIAASTPTEPGLFARPAYLAGDDAAAMLTTLVADHGNGDTYERLRNALFVLTLVDDTTPDSDGDGDGEDLEEFMRRGAFGLDEAWPYKAVSLRVPLGSTPRVGLHMEHAMIDGGTIVAVIAAAQQAAADLDPGADGAPVAWEPVSWTLTEDQRARLVAAGEDYEQQAAGLRFRIVTEPIEPFPTLPFKAGLDGVLQLVMLYAQLATYGRVRSTYESVDMREYRAGRTECLRPNTPEAVACATAMVAGEAGPVHLEAAMAAHRARIKSAKAGQAIDRHLFGLHLMAERDGLRAPLIDDEGYRALTTDFLSTTSLGSRAQIVRTAFAPTSAGGLGLYYSASDRDVDVCISYDEREASRVTEFEENLRAGVRAVRDLMVAAASDAAAVSRAGS
ncbi:choline/carnitine O-acyltransferase [Mobilicoccus caccae]|uniref:Choline/carnitine acyltransferase domain-containing protein n=1 Tax=Mobilicoccus caccae TaxID=1859295 RepID=A0ABQ6IMS3_9MICO|nr:choline/carnitine O-acyltransferase [Mobilicoccus caccae]GMA38503.1 hypothetical protein GCM10025883_05480 [Mobilicoccus caccae]